MAGWGGTVAAPGGASFRIYQQSEIQSCGLACVLMVKRIIDGSQLTERILKDQMGGKGFFGTGDDQYDVATKDRFAGMQRTALTSTAVATGDAHYGSGTARLAVRAMLDQLGIAYSTAGNARAAIRKVAPGKPVIAGVTWTGGGGHWVLVVGRQKNAKGASSNYYILDPGDNTQVVNNLTSRVYTAPYGSVGRFDDDFVAIT